MGQVKFTDIDIFLFKAEQGLDAEQEMHPESQPAFEKYTNRFILNLWWDKIDSGCPPQS